VRSAHSFVPQEAFEDRADVARAPEHCLDLRPPAAQTEDDEIAWRRIPAPLAVDGDRNAALEERLTHQQLPAPGELGYEGFH
jgi:hypothetical protein